MLRAAQLPCTRVQEHARHFQRYDRDTVNRYSGYICKEESNQLFHGIRRQVYYSSLATKPAQPDCDIKNHGI